MPIIDFEWELPEAEELRDAQSRSGAFWAVEEYEVLIDAARARIPLTEIATTLRRSPGGVTSRARRTLPQDWTRGGSSWWEDLCDLLEDDPTYTWQKALRASGEILVDYPAIHQVEELPRADPTSVERVAELTGYAPHESKRLLDRLGHGPTTPGDTLKVRNLAEGAGHLPTRAHPGDAGLDLRYCGSTTVTLTADTTTLLPTGIALSVPQGHVGLICPRSGLAAKHGVTVVNAPGIIDHGYTGEVKVCLGIVGTQNTHTIQPGERIAQLVLAPTSTPEVELVDALDDSERDTGGFGSTGNL